MPCLLRMHRFLRASRLSRILCLLRMFCSLRGLRRSEKMSHVLTEGASAADETPGAPLIEGNLLFEDILLAEDILLSSSAEPARGTETTSDFGGKGWVKVQRKPKKRVLTNQPRWARTQRRKEFMQPWSEHRGTFLYSDQLSVRSPSPQLLQN